MNPFIAPTAGEDIPVDKPYLIRWSPTTPGPVFIQLSYDNNIEATNITVSTPNTGNYSWTPVDVFGGRNNYFLVICDLNSSQGPCSYTFDGRFAIGSISSNTLQSTTITETSVSTTNIPLTTSSTSATMTQQPLSTSTTSPLTQTSAPNPNPDLSTGAKAAIGVVVLLFVLAVVGLTVLFIWKRRKGASQTQPASSDAKAISEYHKAELPTEGNSKEPVRVELSGSGVGTGYASANVEELATD
ncbi:uncharacterized protein LY89DRAFT_723642 [Mollisia scopiformis]|uniref:Yeast cell wall synthesis Kre9/Knh1-like N-terminal domain-containing protein n=1 Tax=Mollisia scopiformis TaxID=149040 RepID=A0A132BEZ2_MOLSC|nr:uncharacterized protein LY89DRAFT_723642 [Mollisia scopiformis]KUJ10434.1 hypothetical protein LY89DRAFT_723642 [Mollisia scopiformis]